MTNDIIFKSKAFGGYDKNEVMEFVNRIVAEKVELEKRLSESNAKFAQVNSQLFETRKIIEANENAVNDLAVANQKITELQIEIDEQKNNIASLEAANSEKVVEIEQLKNELSNCSTSEEIQNEMEALRAEISMLKIEAEKKKDLERQVGAAMLDARVHSEELVEQAKEKANAVTKSVYSAIGETALKIDALSADIGEIARSFTKSTEELELRVKALTGDMSKTAQLLIAESGVITDNVEPKAVEYDFTVDEDVVTEISIDPSDYGVNDISKIEFTNDSDI